MLKYLKIISSYLSSPELLILTGIFSFSFKLYLLIIIINHSIITKENKKNTFLLIGILLASMIYSDASSVPHYFYKIYIPDLDKRIIAFMARLGWLFFIVQNQTLILFLDNIIQKKFKLRYYHICSLSISIVLFLFQLYFLIFKFNQPILQDFELLMEQRLIQLECLYLVILLVPTFYRITNKIRLQILPKILSHQLKIFIFFLVLPHFFLDLVTNKLIFFSFLDRWNFLNKFAIQSLSSLLISYALYYCSKKMMDLRFLNLKNHVEVKDKFNFINDFKDILEELSFVTTLNELIHITQMFFQRAFKIPISMTKFYVRNVDGEYAIDLSYNLSQNTKLIEQFISKCQNSIDKEYNYIGLFLKKHKIFIKDEIEFSNFYEETEERTQILNFMNGINADIFLPIYDRQNIIAYIIVEQNARVDELFNSAERDQMLVFTSYLSNVINTLRHSNLDALLRHKKELQDELFEKYQEINQYKESIRSFLRSDKDLKVGIVFYKNRKFTYANQSAKDLLNIDINNNSGHALSKCFRQLALQVQEYKVPKTVFTKDGDANKLVLSAIPSLEESSVIIIVHYPEVTDIIKANVNLLKDTSSLDWLLYLETTKSGQLINQLLPGNGENLLDFKINLLSAALSRKATLLNLPQDDLITTVELLHHISLRPNLHLIKLSSEEKNNEVAMELFGINSIFDINETGSDPLLSKLDNIGTLFIENIELLSLETQNQLAEFIVYGYFKRLKSDRKIFSNVRIICSSNKNLETLVAQGQFSKVLYSELNKASISMPSLLLFSDQEIIDLAQGFTDQTINTQTYKTFLSLDSKDKDKLLDQRPISLQDLKDKVQKLIVSKSNKHNIYSESSFDPAYNIVDPVIAKAVRLGKRALKYQELMIALWDKYKNQNKIASLLGVDRSSVCRRCQQYNLK
ncbi:sigma 54-interacting transcriptional regulator [Candidatus Babela massiliensis]|nr:sigma 54-interacting transcriptional regulator [Candidatus Babela massiliensis]